MTYVPRNLLRTKPSYLLVNPGAPVRAAGTWRELADGIQWIAGKGAQLVPFFSTNFQVAAGVTKTLRFRVRPRGKAIRRVWGLLLQANTFSVGTSVTIRAPAVTGTAVTTDIGFRALFWQPFQYIEDLTAKSSTEQEISIDIAATGGTANVLGIGCYEEDRSALNDDATDYGIRVETVVPRAPMIDVAQTSLRGVYDPYRAGHGRGVLAAVGNAAIDYGSSAQNPDWKAQLGRYYGAMLLELLCAHGDVGRHGRLGEAQHELVRSERHGHYHGNHIRLDHFQSNHRVGRRLRVR
jgi:hypothetical protein